MKHSALFQVKNSTVLWTPVVEGFCIIWALPLFALLMSLSKVLATSVIDTAESFFLSGVEQARAIPSSLRGFLGRVVGES